MENLSELVERYGLYKDQIKPYEAQIKKDNEEIKKLMASSNKSEFSSGGYTAKYSVSVSEDFDETKLIAKLNSIGSDLGIIKMKPYVDMEALENAIYSGKIKAEDLSSCKIKKETAKLLISKTKKKEAK